MPAEAVRAFVALPCPPGVRDELARAIEGWRSSFEGVRWSDPTRVHLTLRFLGQAPIEALERLGPGLARAAAASRPLALEPDATGAFPGWGRARVLWLGFAKEPALIELAAAVEAATREVGFEPEERGFTPHLTIGRLADPRAARPAVAAVRGWRPQSGAEEVREVVLFRSDLGPGGARHDPLARYPLGERGR